jgi:hypothetical protein
MKLKFTKTTIVDFNTNAIGRNEQEKVHGGRTLRGLSECETRCVDSYCSIDTTCIPATYTVVPCR